MAIQGILTGGTQPQGGGGLFSGLGDKVRAREDYDKKKNTIVRSALKKGKSWEDISKETGLDVAEVRSLSEAIDPNYGIKKPKSLVTTAKENVKKNISSALDFGGAVESVIQDVTGGTARREKLLEDQQKLISLRKKEIERSGVLSPETKKKLIGELTAQQRGSFAKATAERSNQLGELNRTLENPVIRGGAAFGAGVKRSGEGVAQGVGGIYDLATPGKGQSRLTQAATRSAEGSDKFVQDNQLSDVAYKGGQLTGEALQLLTGTKAIKAMASLPGASKLVAVAGKADELENLLRTVNKGGKAGDAAITAARYLLDPARVANILQNTAVDQGQLAARGQDINAKTVATSVGTNYALGGVLDAASAGLTRRATNKANIAQDAATLADNARINDQMAGAGDLASELPTPGQRQLGAGSPQPVQTAGASGGVMQTNVPATSDLKRLEVVQKKIASAQKRGGLGADEARALMQERTMLIERIQNPTVAQGAPTPTTGSTSSATAVDQPTLTQDIPTGSRTGATATSQPGDMKTTGSALATERRAIEDSIVKELPDKAQYKSGSYTQETDKAIELVQNNRARAEAIAFGGEPGDNVIHEVAVRKALEAQARKNKDANTLQRIAQSQSNVKTSEAAQRLGAEGYNKDPESPVEAMKDVLKARKDTKLKGIPKDLSADESAKITDLADKVSTAKAELENGGDRFAYGEALGKLRRYKNELIDGTKTRRDKLMPKGVINATFGTAKSVKASLDNSFFGRQGLKVLTTHPTVWGKAFMKSWGDIGKGLKGIDALDALDADTLSRVNNINGRYGKMKLDVHSTEEAFPSALPEKVPGLGRLFKASEYAYVGAAHRMRADLADQLLEKAQKAGVDIDDAEQLEKIGKLINSMTGRGHLGKAEGGADVLNNLFFSPRNWKSNIDTITAHQFQKGTNVFNRDKSAKFVRKEAAQNLVKMIAVVGATMAAAENFKPGSVEKDPRSSDFGKIKIGNTRFDVSGGMASIATVATRLATRETKSSTTGQVTKLNGDEFGARSTWDVLMDYAEGKMSPGAGAIKQVLTGKNFIGEKVTPGSFAKDLFMPLPVSNYEELKNDPKSANTLIAMISDGLGVGTNTYSAQKDWNKSDTKRIGGFKETVDAKKFSEANNAFNEAYSQWVDKVTTNEEFKKLPPQTQKTLLSQKSQDLTDQVLKDYGYEYKAKKKSGEETRTIKQLKQL
jgi:hypothetical protein